MKIILSKLKWYHYDTVWVTGFIREGSSYLNEFQLLKRFSGIDNIDDFEKELLAANGQFSVIVQKSNQLWAATDRLRNFPLFYTMINGEIAISDDCYKLALITPDKEINPDAADCLLAGGFTLNRFTVINGIYQVEAGEFIVAGESLKRKFYHKPSLNPVSLRDIETAGTEMQNVFDEVFEAHFNGLRDNFIAIPLSGGFDSRLIALMCAKYHPENVLCFTYGREGNREQALAKEAAKRLGLNWINIIYDKALIEGYIEDNDFMAYYHYSSGLTSMFYMQDYFAVRYLKDNNIIPENTVFVPGFSGDSLAGSFFTSSLKNHTKSRQIASRIFNDKFGLINLERKTKQIICQLIEEKINIDIIDCWKNYEEWEIKEIHAKFIINSAKVFPFFGYNYVMPFFDNLIIDFFTSLPFELKLYKKLYDCVLIKKIFRQSNVNLKDEINPKPFQRNFQHHKERVKQYIPTLIKNILIDLRSPIFYDEITRVMIEDIGYENIIKPKQANYYNSYLSQWYLYKIREMYGIL